MKDEKEFLKSLFINLTGNNCRTCSKNAYLVKKRIEQIEKKEKEFKRVVEG